MFRPFFQRSSTFLPSLLKSTHSRLCYPLIHQQRLLSTSILLKRTALLSIPSIYQQRPFSISCPRLTNGDVDPDLVHLLEEELKFEKSDDKDEPPAFIKEFLDTNLFHIDDRPGHDKVILSRTFGNEKINVIFSISDINKPSETEKEITTDDVDDDGSEKIIKKKDDSVDQDLEDAAFPVRATILIQKEGVRGALVLHTVAQDGYLNINSTRFFKDEIKNITDFHNEHQLEEKDSYMGPNFDELNDDIQTTFSQYLEERGINTALATFLPDYVDYKEQKEYEIVISN
ncbi:mitochondrial glycoprotein [Cokeromyces recurvatus]|uniref:mitochondrial glycoprotein n=1 Tax=Cokeromyces recurvatus TaxID=90255 RepID=UPI00222030E6|nr:mitochondrial glycoprotein [Cokeromyces recurvatus]KAI7898571.1 mitochondrial glycoprotein [Cokeromyces recurvatus]